jgi:energy-converting hydrogenase Eha subunit C
VLPFPYYFTSGLTSLLIFQQPNVNVSANIALNVYGKNRVNITIDLCELLKGVICPLPMYNFTGADTLILPPSLIIPINIPPIIYKIPDLEGFFQLVLTEVNTGAVKACIQATISNGRSAHQPAVERATEAIALAALFSAGWYSFASPEATVPFRFLELIYLYQSIASSSFLSLNYPSVYRAFSLNFAWAIGLIPSSTLQNSIERMRHLTGGHLADATKGSAVGFVNRKLSPYDSRLVLASLHDTITGGVQVVTSKSSNVLQAGIPIFVNTIHIATANAFMTVFIVALGMFAIATIIFILGYGSIFTLHRIRRRNNGSVFHPFSCKSLSFVRGWFLRLVCISSVFTIIVIRTANL